MNHVLYHASCYDGFGAAFAAWRFFGNTAKYTAVDYGKPMPDLGFKKEDSVYIVDFAYDKETLLSLKEQVNFLIVLDHHKTHEAALKGLDFAQFDMNRSGAMLAWNYFFPAEEPPDLIKYIQDRDLWLLSLPNSNEIQCGLKAYPFDFNLWNNFMNPEGLNKLLLEGTSIAKHVKQTVSNICAQAVIRTIGDVEMPIANTGGYWSEVGEELLYKYPNYKAACSFTYQKESILFSLRSLNERQLKELGREGEEPFDVSAIALKFGGGGHKSAAGFRVLYSDLPEDGQYAKFPCPII